MICSAILSIIPLIGQLVAIFFNFAVCALIMFAIFLVVDKEMAFWPASMESIRTVKTNFWPFLGLYVVTSIIGGIGSIALGIGIIFTMPIQFCMLTVAYRHIFKTGEVMSTTG